jgi:thiamine-phosphate pyrophosphorylase
VRAKVWQDGASARAATLAKLAQRLKAGSVWRAVPLPSLWLVTDQARGGDPLAAAQALPPGAGILFRHYRAANRAALAWNLAAVAAERGLFLTVGADAALARKVGALMLHLPRWAEARHLRSRLSGWRGLVSVSVHNARELQAAARLPADLVFLGPALPTASHPGAPALGALRFAALARTAAAPAIALGGIDEATAPRLTDTDAAGIAAVGALAT